MASTRHSRLGCHSSTTWLRCAERAVALYGAGASLQAVAAQLGVTRPAVRAVLTARGATIRPSRNVMGLVDAERAVELYTAGISLARIADQLDVTPPAVRAVLVAAGVTIRPPRNAVGPVDADRAAALYAGGATLRGIAGLLGVGRAAVRSALSARGVTIRPVGPMRRPRSGRSLVAASPDAAIPAPTVTAEQKPHVIFQPFPTTSTQPSRPDQP